MGNLFSGDEVPAPQPTYPRYYRGRWQTAAPIPRTRVPPMPKGNTLDDLTETCKTKNATPARQENMKRIVRGLADINEKNRSGETPLTAAAKSNNDWAINYLLSQGASIDITNSRGETPLNNCYKK